MQQKVDQAAEEKNEEIGRCQEENLQLERRLNESLERLQNEQQSYSL